jgi:hypothetical protein
MSRIAQKSKFPPAATPIIGQNAKNLDDLLAALKDEYLYNTRVIHSSPAMHVSHLPESPANSKKSLHESRETTT